MEPMNYEGVVVLALSAILLYFAYDTYWNGKVEYVTSTVDGRSYLVQSQPDKEAAANLLAQIRANLIQLRRHLEKTAPDDERTMRLVQRFNPDNISEGAENAKYTSYSINKGEKIVFCLRSRDKNNRLMDINTMTFVALHELAHISSKTIGHDETFWTNFKWILERAVKTGIYKEQDFKKKPVEYCGIQITDSPLYH